ncbi:MAG: tyrosine-type recombinase/integrase, partial [Desulfobulbales bacterium]
PVPSTTSSESPVKVSPIARREQQRRRIFARIVQRLSAEDLPGKEHAVSYLTSKFRRNCKAGTLESNGTAIRFFLTFLKSSGRVRLENMDRHDIEGFVEHEQDRGLQIRGVRTRLVGVYSFIRHLIDNEILVPELLTKKIRLKLPDPLPRAMDAADVQLLFSVIKQPRDKALFLLLLRTGMRIGELLDLQVSDVDLQEQKILIYTGEKNSRGRVVYFSDDARIALADWLKKRNPEKEYLFYSVRNPYLTYAAVRKRFNTYLEKTGLTHKGYTIHQLRHTFATELLNAGMRIECLQPLLGHSNLEITRRYARLSNKSREAEYFRVMSTIEKEMSNGNNQLDYQLQAAPEEKKLFIQHG